MIKCNSRNVFCEWNTNSDNIDIRDNRKENPMNKKKLTVIIIVAVIVVAAIVVIALAATGNLGGKYVDGKYVGQMVGTYTAE